MPFPAKVSAEAIAEAARAMIEQDGVEALSLGRLADELGVKAPSFYRYYPNKTALLKAVNTLTIASIVSAMHSALEATQGDLTARLIAMFHAYRAYARAHPAVYGLAFGTTPPETQADADYAEALALPIQSLVAQISGEARALDALRGAWALTHGFVSLENSGQFRRGGDLDDTYDTAIRAYLAGWQ